MPIFDGRPSISEFSIDTHGFRVANLQTKLTQTMETLFADDQEEIKGVYYPEIEALVKRTVQLADGRLPKYAFATRTQKFSEEKDRGFLASYSHQAHTDFTDIVFQSTHKMLTKRGVPNQEAQNMDILMVNTGSPSCDPRTRTRWPCWTGRASL